MAPKKTAEDAAAVKTKKKRKKKGSVKGASVVTALPPAEQEQEAKTFLHTDHERIEIDVTGLTKTMDGKCYICPRRVVRNVKMCEDVDDDEEEVEWVPVTDEKDPHIEVNRPQDILDREEAKWLECLDQYGKMDLASESTQTFIEEQVQMASLRAKKGTWTDQHAARLRHTIESQIVLAREIRRRRHPPGRAKPHTDELCMWEAGPPAAPRAAPPAAVVVKPKPKRLVEPPQQPKKPVESPRPMPKKVEKAPEVKSTQFLDRLSHQFDIAT